MYISFEHRCGFELKRNCAKKVKDPREIKGIWEEDLNTSTLVHGKRKLTTRKIEGRRHAKQENYRYQQT